MQKREWSTWVDNFTHWSIYSREQRPRQSVTAAREGLENVLQTLEIPQTVLPLLATQPAGSPLSGRGYY